MSESAIIFKTSQWRKYPRANFRPSEQNNTRLLKAKSWQRSAEVNKALTRHFKEASTVSATYKRRCGKDPIENITVSLTPQNAEKLKQFEGTRGKTTAVINRSLELYYASKN